LQKLQADVTVADVPGTATPHNRVKELLEATGKSRLDLALYLQVTEDTARRLERPEDLIPSKYIAPLVAWFGVTSDHLLGLDRDRSEQLEITEATAAP
jgi:transcriptional regulator with XRE-family HTH domain